MNARPPATATTLAAAAAAAPLPPSSFASSRLSSYAPSIQWCFNGSFPVRLYCARFDDRDR